MRAFVQTGQYSYVNNSQFQQSVLNSTTRQSRLGNTLFFKPRHMMGSLHAKTHFKAGDTVKHQPPGPGSLKVGKEEQANKWQAI